MGINFPGGILLTAEPSTLQVLKSHLAANRNPRLPVYIHVCANNLTI